MRCLRSGLLDLWHDNAFVALVVLGGWAYHQHPKFGAMPEGAHLAAISHSPNHDGAEFLSLEPSAVVTSEKKRSSLEIFRDVFVVQRERLRPDWPPPVGKTDLRALPADRDTIVWLGHSSYFVQFGGRRFPIDPVFGVAAAPVFSRTKLSPAPAFTPPRRCPRSTTSSSPTTTGTTSTSSLCARRSPMSPRARRRSAGVGAVGLGLGCGAERGRGADGSFRQAAQQVVEKVTAILMVAKRRIFLASGGGRRGGRGRNRDHGRGC